MPLLAAIAVSLALAGPALAQPAPDDKTRAVVAEFTGVNAGYPALSGFFNTKPAAETTAFARAAPADAAERRRLWSLLEALLSGGKLDEKGEAMRRELARLPVAELYRVAVLEDEKRKIVAKLGEGSWYKNGVSNLKAGLNDHLGMNCDAARTLCKDRANDLEFAVDNRAMPEDSGWVTRTVSVRLDAGNEHSATCAVYTKTTPPVELMADAWLNAHLPAERWLADQDPPFHEALRAAGKGYCGEEYKALVEKKRLENEKAEAEARALAERAAKIRERLSGAHRPGAW